MRYTGSNVTAGILVGGHSRRMGRPKALIEVGGVTLLERTLDIARAACGEVVLLGRPPFDLPQAVTGLPALPDSQPGLGPIGGLQSLLCHVEMARTSVGILLGCDMPHLAAELLDRLISTPGDHDAVVPRTGGSDGRLHPCCALYRLSALPVIRRQIAARQYAMMGLHSSLRVLPIELTGDQARWVENWNAPPDVCRC